MTVREMKAVLLKCNLCKGNGKFLGRHCINCDGAGYKTMDYWSVVAEFSSVERVDEDTEPIRDEPSYGTCPYEYGEDREGPPCAGPECYNFETHHPSKCDW